MGQKFEHSDFPSTMTVSSGNGPIAVIGQSLHFTALEDGLWIGTGPDMYYMKIDWRNVGHVVRWLQTQNRKNR